MITISIELLSSFSLSDLCNLIIAFCEIITLLILIIGNKRKKVETLPSKPDLVAASKVVLVYYVKFLSHKSSCTSFRFPVSYISHRVLNNL